MRRGTLPAWDAKRDQTLRRGIIGVPGMLLSILRNTQLPAKSFGAVNITKGVYVSSAKNTINWRMPTDITKAAHIPSRGIELFGIMLTNRKGGRTIRPLLAGIFGWRV